MFTWTLYLRSPSSGTHVVSIVIIQTSITSTSSVMHVMVNHYVMIDGAGSVYMHLHLYHTHTSYHALRIKNSLISTSSVIVIKVNKSK